MDTFRQDSFRFGRKRKEIILNTYRMEPKITPRQMYPTIYKKLRRIVSSLAKAGLNQSYVVQKDYKSSTWSGYTQQLETDQKACKSHFIFVKKLRQWCWESVPISSRKWKTFNLIDSVLLWLDSFPREPNKVCHSNHIQLPTPQSMITLRTSSHDFQRYFQRLCSPVLSSGRWPFGLCRPRGKYIPWKMFEILSEWWVK